MKATIIETLSDGGYATQFKVSIDVGKVVRLDGKRYEEDVKALKDKTQMVFEKVNELLATLD